MHLKIGATFMVLDHSSNAIIFGHFNLKCLRHQGALTSESNDSNMKLLLQLICFRDTGYHILETTVDLLLCGIFIHHFDMDVFFLVIASHSK